mgnify:CR=1 FL=1
MGQNPYKNELRGDFFLPSDVTSYKGEIMEELKPSEEELLESIKKKYEKTVKAYEAIREATVPETVIAPTPRQIPKLFNPNEEDYKRKDVSTIKPVNSLKTKLLSFDN